jgi:hypothetical protein
VRAKIFDSLNREVTKSFVEKLVALILIMALIFYFVVSTNLTRWNRFGIFGEVVREYGWLYWIRYYTPNWLPLLFYAAFLIISTLENVKVHIISTKLSWTLFTLTCFSLLIFIIASSHSFSPSDFMSKYFKWSWAAIIEWNVAFSVGFWLMWKKTKEAFYSLIFAVALLSSGGMIYELPVYNINAFQIGHYLGIQFPFFIATDFISLFFLVYLLHIKKWHPSKYFYIALICFVIHGLWWWQHPNSLNGYCWILTEYEHQLEWLPRIFGIVLLWSLTSGIKVEGK